MGPLGFWEKFRRLPGLKNKKQIIELDKKDISEYLNQIDLMSKDRTINPFTVEA